MIESACDELPPADDPPIECVDDSDCPDGQLCGEDGACQPYVG